MNTNVENKLGFLLQNVIQHHFNFLILAVEIHKQLLLLLLIIFMSWPLSAKSTSIGM